MTKSIYAGIGKRSSRLAGILRDAPGVVLAGNLCYSSLISDALKGVPWAAAEQGNVALAVAGEFQGCL